MQNQSGAANFYKYLAYFAFIISSLASFFILNSSQSLLLGFLISLLIKDIPRHEAQRYVKKLLPLCVIGLGFGMNFSKVVDVGFYGIMLSVLSIFFTLQIGLFLGKRLSIDFVTSYLISVGTAICGGSAIAAIAPVIGAKGNQIAVSLGLVFLLNAIALLIFPLLGSSLGLTESEFGFWAAIAIHDTSSVVGAAGEFGAGALEIAVPVKLSRALWILPLLWFSKTYFKQAGRSNASFPWFIILFVLASLLSTLLPSYKSFWFLISGFAKNGLSLTLLYIGFTLSIDNLKAVGFRALGHAFLLWFLVSLVSLGVILALRA